MTTNDINGMIEKRKQVLKKGYMILYNILIYVLIYLYFHPFTTPPPLSGMVLKHSLLKQRGKWEFNYFLFDLRHGINLSEFWSGPWYREVTFIGECVGNDVHCFHKSPYRRNVSHWGLDFIDFTWNQRNFGNPIEYDISEGIFIDMQYFSLKKSHKTIKYQPPSLGWRSTLTLILLMSWLNVVWGK